MRGVGGREESGEKTEQKSVTSSPGKNTVVVEKMGSKSNKHHKMKRERGREQHQAENGLDCCHDDPYLGQPCSPRGWFGKGGRTRLLSPPS